MCYLTVKTVDHVASNALLGSFVAWGHAQPWRMMRRTVAVVGWCAKMGLCARTAFAVMLLEAVHGVVSWFGRFYSLWMIQGYPC